MIQLCSEFTSVLWRTPEVFLKVFLKSVLTISNLIERHLYTKEVTALHSVKRVWVENLWNCG